LKTTAGVLISFSVFLLLQEGHTGIALLPNGRECSKTVPHLAQRKSKVGMEGW
jgi:hypothetical protein